VAVNVRIMPVSRDAVWAVLCDGRGYGRWVVGTSHIREVDEGFPAAGTKLHYSIGWGPLRHDGHTEVCYVENGVRLVLEANAWPAGAMRIDIDLSDATAEGCRVRMDERPSRGMASLFHNPLQDLVLRGRNVECLRRLERLARERAAGGDGRAVR